MLIYDGDEAGQNATKRAIPMLEKAGLKVKVLKMRDAKDPDEYLKKFGADKFKILLEESSNRVEYQLNAIMKKYDLREDEQRVQFIAEAAEFISTLNNAVQREIYGNRAAEAAAISSEAMKIEVGKAFKRRISREKRKEVKVALAPAAKAQPKERNLHYDNVKSALAEEKIIAMLLREPALIDQCKGLKAGEFSSNLLGRVYAQICRNAAQGLDTSMAALTEFTGEEMSHLASVIHNEKNVIDEQAFGDCLRTVRMAHQMDSARTDTSDDALLAMRNSMQSRKGQRP